MWWNPHSLDIAPIVQQLFAPMQDQALRRLPAIFTGYFQKPWPFTRISQALLMYPQDCLLPEQSSILSKETSFAIPALFCFLGSGIFLKQIQLSHQE